MKTTFIYALCNSEGQFDYVGLSGNPKRRIREHKRAGIIIQEVPWDEGPAREQFWILFFLDQGCELRNQNLGGGGPAIHTEEARAKIGAAQIGKKLGPRSEEHRANLSAACKGLRRSAEHSALRSRVQKGKKRGAYQKKTEAQAMTCAANHFTAQKGKKRGPYKKKAL